MEELNKYIYSDINNTDLRMKGFKESQQTIITDTTDEDKSKKYLKSNIYIPLKDFINPDDAKELLLYKAYLQVSYNQSLLLTKQESKVNSSFRISKEDKEMLLKYKK